MRRLSLASTPGIGNCAGRMNCYTRPFAINVVNTAAVEPITDRTNSISAFMRRGTKAIVSFRRSAGFTTEVLIRASASNNPSEHVLKRSRTMTVERLGLTEFRVTPSEPGKVVRIVRFHADYEPARDRYRQVGEFGPDEVPRLTGVWIECFAEKSKRACRANSFADYCSHCEAAIVFLLTETAKQ